MNPKEEAENLVCEFSTIQSNEYDYGINWEMAKQCALIAVNEILNHKNNFIQIQFQFTYWQEVKQEIEKL